MNMKEAYQKKVEAQLDEWDADIKKIKAKANQTEANAQLEIQKQMADLKRRRKMAADRLAELRAASDDAWEDLKDGLESAKESLGIALQSATQRFK